MRRLILLVLVAAALPWPPGAAASPRRDAAVRGAKYLASRQSPNGALFSPDAPAHSVAEAIVALVAGDSPRDAIDRALGYVRERGAASATQGAYAGRLVLGLVAAGEEPRTFGGFDYVGKLRSYYNPATGAYDTSSVYGDSLAVLGVLAAGESPPDQALAYLRANQCRDGGFGHQTACLGGADVDTTALAFMVLRDERAVAYLASMRNRDGGFGHRAGEETNANSTGLALSALAALDEPPASGTVEALLALQEPSGGFRWKASGPKPDDYATVQAVPGAAGMALPLRPQARAGEPAVAPAPTTTARVTERQKRRDPARPTPSPEVRLEDRVPHRAGVIVSTQQGAKPRQVCVAFDEPEISGHELLVRAGLDVAVETSAQGTAICRIGSTGCGGGRDCFCSYPTFWRYWTRDPAEQAWRFSEVGAAARKVGDGSLDAWSWTSSGKPPSVRSLAEVCSPDGPLAPASARPPSASSRDYAMFAALGVLLASGAGVVAARRKKASR